MSCIFLGHFCENHGASVVFTTENLRTLPIPDDLSNISSSLSTTATATATTQIPIESNNTDSTSSISISSSTTSKSSSSTTSTSTTTTSSSTASCAMCHSFREGDFYYKNNLQIVNKKKKVVVLFRMISMNRQAVCL